MLALIDGAYFSSSKITKTLVICFMAFPDNNYIFVSKTAIENWNGVETFARHINPASKVKSVAFSSSSEFDYQEKETSKPEFFSTFSLNENQPIISTIPLFS